MSAVIYIALHTLKYYFIEPNNKTIYHIATQMLLFCSSFTLLHFAASIAYISIMQFSSKQIHQVAGKIGIITLLTVYTHSVYPARPAQRTLRLLLYALPHTLLMQ